MTCHVAAEEQMERKVAMYHDEITLQLHRKGNPKGKGKGCQPNGPAEVQCEFPCPISGLTFRR